MSKSRPIPYLTFLWHQRVKFDPIEYLATVSDFTAYTQVIRRFLTNDTNRTLSGNPVANFHQRL